MTDVNERLRQRYADDPEYRKRRLAANNAYKKRNKVKLNAKARLRYATDPEFRERTLTDCNAYRKRHKAEINAKARLRWATDADFRESNRAFKLKSCYGMTIEQYNALFAKQKGRCAICNKTSERKLFVDHCHRTKLVRGLLCLKCNSGMGFLDDHPRLLRKALAYAAGVLKPKRRPPPKPNRRERTRN